MWEHIGRFLYHIAPQVLGAGLTIWAGFKLVNRYYATRSNEADLIDYIVREVDVLLDLAEEYWARPVEDDERNAMLFLAQKIKGRLGAIFADVEFYRRKYKSGGCEDYRDMVADLHKAVTGGTFESKKRVPDASRYLLGVNLAAKLKSALVQNKI